MCCNDKPYLVKVVICRIPQVKVMNKLVEHTVYTASFLTFATATVVCRTVVMHKAGALE